MTSEIKSATAAQSQAITPKTSETDLSETTRKELEALGIPVTEGMTEAQAREKIQEARAEQAQGIVGGLSGEAEVTSDIKTLAATIGLTIEDDSSAEDILEEIAEELEAQIDEAEGNPQELSTLMGYFRQLSKLDAEYTVIQEGQAKLFNAMELVSRANKQDMGLDF